MIFRPTPPRKLWDTWLFPWGGQYHLFYLETQDGRWDHVGHAVSVDLLHWEARESICTRGPEGSWNHRPTLTGMVIAHENCFCMLLGSSTENDKQAISFTMSGQK